MILIFDSKILTCGWFLATLSFYFLTDVGLAEVTTFFGPACLVPWRIHNPRAGFPSHYREFCCCARGRQLGKQGQKGHYYNSTTAKAEPLKLKSLSTSTEILHHEAISSHGMRMHLVVFQQLFFTYFRIQVFFPSKRNGAFSHPFNFQFENLQWHTVF